MNKNCILYITNFDTLEGSLDTHKDLFEKLNKNFDNFVIMNWTNLTIFKKKKKLFQIKTNFNLFNPSSFLEVANFCENKKVVAISNFGKNYGTFKIARILKKLKIPIFMISNIGNPSGGSMIRSIKYPVLFFKSYFKKHIFQKLILIFMIMGILPKVEVRFLSNKKILKNIENSKFKSFLLKKKFFTSKKITLINSRSYDFYIQKKINISEEYIVHLDASLNYKEETELRGYLPQKILKQHYYFLERFLLKLSNEFKKKIIVCIHPGYDLEHHKSFFKDFEVYKFRTREFIYKSFITTNFDSSAVEDAILLKKRIIGLKSNYMSKNETEHSKKYAKLVGYHYVDIEKDYNFKKDDLFNLITNKLDNYDKHIETFHKFDENKIGSDKIIKIIKEGYL